MTFVVEITGRKRGASLYGPFDSADEAADWAKENANMQWSVRPVIVGHLREQKR